MNDHIYDEVLAKIGWKLDLPRFSYDYQKLMFVKSLIEYLIPFIVLIIEFGIINKIWSHSPIFIWNMSLGCLLFDPHRTTHQSNTSAWLRKVTA